MGVPISLMGGFGAFERRQLELDVQNLVGPIINIELLSRATLCGIRDDALRRAAPQQPPGDRAGVR